MEDETGTPVPATENETQRAAPGNTCPVVGIGASAGGIEALRRMFPYVAPDSGMAFVIVQHLDPERESLLAEIIARTCSLAVAEIDHDTLVEPNHVYVLPPNASL